MQVRKSRAVQRSARSRSSTPTVAVVGYTNAGKSSLVSRLARCDISVQDRCGHFTFWYKINAMLGACSLCRLLHTHVIALRQSLWILAHGR